MFIFIAIVFNLNKNFLRSIALQDPNKKYFIYTHFYTFHSEISAMYIASGDKFVSIMVITYRRIFVFLLTIPSVYSFHHRITDLKPPHALYTLQPML